MQFSRSNGSSRLRRSIKTVFSLFLPVCFLAPSFASAQVKVMDAVRVVLLQIDSFAEAHEIQQAIRKMDGVGKVTPIEQAPGVVTYGIQHIGTPDAIVDGLRGIFGEKYQITKKSLPTGVVEINVASSL